MTVAQFEARQATPIRPVQNRKMLISEFARIERQITALHVEQTALAMATNLRICLD